jgi:hypothetical protein
LEELIEINETIDVLVPEQCWVEGSNKCIVTKYAQDYSCRINSSERQYNIDLTPPETNKEVGEPKVETFGEWIEKLVNGFFVNDKTYITLHCEDNLSGCNETYYTIDFQPFYENESYGGWSNVVTNKEYNNTPFTLNEGDGLYNITYWSVDNAGNIEEKKFEVDKLDLYAPKTSIIFTGMVIEGPRTIPEYNLNVLMNFIRPSYYNETTESSNPIINLTATDSEVGVNKTYYQILVPSNETTDHVEAYIEGQWYEENNEEFQSCLEDNKCYEIVDYSLNEDDFSEDEFDVGVDVERNGSIVRWIVNMSGAEGHWSTGVQVMVSDESNPLYNLGWSPGDSTSSPIYKEYNSGWGSATTILPPGMSVSGNYNETYYIIEIPVEYLECPWRWAINVEATWSGESSSVQQNYPSNWGRWTATNTAEGIGCVDYFQCEEECNLTYWELSPQFLNMSCESEWCEYNDETGIIFDEECDHKICYYSEDRLENKEDVECVVFSVDGEGPKLALHNPDPLEAEFVEECSMSIEVEAIDEKVGIEEIAGIIATVYNKTYSESYNLTKTPWVGSAYEGTMYGQVISLDGLAAGNYSLMISAIDKLGNARTYTRNITLGEGIFIDKSWNPSCSVGEAGGECDLEFRACVRNSTGMDFYMSKINEDLAFLDLEPTLIIGNNSGKVGRLNTSEGYFVYGDIVPFSDNLCEVMNGWTSFVVSLNFTEETVDKIGFGDYDFDYQVNSYFDDLCVISQIPS